MDHTNPQKLSSLPWDVSMAMEDLLPNYGFENHHIHHSSSSTSAPEAIIPSSSSSVLNFISDHQIMANQYHLHQVVPEQHGDQLEEGEEQEEEELGVLKEMMFKIAAMQPVDIDPATIRKPKRRNVRISDDPQSVAARHRRERISEKIRILQRLVPGGTKMDTASMLDEAIRYVKFLKRQIRQLQANSINYNNNLTSFTGGIPARTNWASAMETAAAITSNGTSYSTAATTTTTTITTTVSSSVFGCFNYQVIGD